MAKKRQLISDLIDSYNKAVEKEDREQANYFLGLLIDNWTYGEH